MKVREVIRLLEEAGWQRGRFLGSRRQVRHPTKPGAVTVAGNPSLEVPPGTLDSILEQSGLKCASEMRYGVVIERGESNWGAYVPDLPGCVAAADTREEVVALIRDAIEFHLEGLREDGEDVPEPHSDCEFVEVSAA